MQELYKIARKIHKDIFNKLCEVHLFHNQKELDIEECSLKDISNGDFIIIEVDTYYKSILEKYKNKRISFIHNSINLKEENENKILKEIDFRNIIIINIEFR